MIRRVLLASALVASLVQPAGAQSINDVVATWTRLRAIGMYCPKFYRVDMEYLTNLQGVFEEAGTKSGAQITEAQIRKAGARRDAEVRAAGAKKWCTMWRTKMRGDGTGQVWP